MSITREQVLHMAELTKLEIDPAKLDLFAGQFSVILRHMAQLDTIDTREVEALYHPVWHVQATRPDTLAPSLERDSLLANASGQNGEYFVVPRIVG